MPPIDNGLEWLHDDLRGLTTKVGGVEVEMAGVKGEMAGVKGEIQGVKERLDAHIVEHSESRKTLRNHLFTLVVKIVGAGIIGVGSALATITFLI